MKICHLTSGHSVDDDRIFIKECSSLALFGYDVSIIGCGENNNQDVKNGVKRTTLFIPVKSKLERMLMRSKAVYKEAKKYNADVYHIHEIELFYYALKLKKNGAKIIFDCHEDWLVYYEGVKWLPKIIGKLASLFIKNMFRKYLKRFDAVISVSPHIVNKLNKYSSKVFMITNYPIYNEKNQIHYSQDDYINRENTIFYSGVVYEMSNQEVILNAINNIDNVRYLIAGKLLGKYGEMISNKLLPNKASFLGYLAKEDLNNIYKSATMGIILFDYHGNVGFKTGTLGNNKIFEYMKYALPIICTDFDLWKEMIIDKYKCGICVNPNDIYEVQNAINYLINNKEIAYQMGQNAQKAINKEFNWTSQEKILLDIYNNFNSK